MDDLFEVATGWLGWSPEQAMHTPIPQITLALKGRVDWARKTNPFGGGEAEQPPESDVDVAAKLRAALGARNARDPS